MSTVCMFNSMHVCVFFFKKNIYLCGFMYLYIYVRVCNYMILYVNANVLHTYMYTCLYDVYCMYIYLTNRIHHKYVYKCIYIYMSLRRVYLCV